MVISIKAIVAELDEDIAWRDFKLRNFDAQLGRWIQQDPFSQFNSPYSGMGNDPINLIDPSGDIGIPCPGTSQLALSFLKVGEVALNTLNTLGPASTVVSNAIQVAGSAANIYFHSVAYRIIRRGLFFW